MLYAKFFCAFILSRKSMCLTVIGEGARGFRKRGTGEIVLAEREKKGKIT